MEQNFKQKKALYLTRDTGLKEHITEYYYLLSDAKDFSILVLTISSM